MKKIIVGMVLASMVLVGCKTTVHIIEVERIDQEVDGNRGFIGGTPPPVYEEREVKPLQMIEIEFEVEEKVAD